MPPRPRLPLHEWAVIVLFCAVLALLALLAGSRSPSPPRPTALAESPPDMLAVAIRGAVAQPGVYRLPLTARRRDLLERAHPLPQADLSRVQGWKRLRDGETLIVPEKKWITVHVTGAVEQPGPRLVLSGTRCGELAEVLRGTPAADLAALRRRRRCLQEGEVVQVPVKRAKKAAPSPVAFPAAEATSAVPAA